MSDQPTSNNTFRTRLDMSVTVTFSTYPYMIKDDKEAYFFNRDNQCALEEILSDKLRWLYHSGITIDHLFGSNDKTGEDTFEFVLDRPKADFSIRSAVNFLPEVERFIVQLSSNLSKDIVENKPTLDILTDFATIIGATIPFVSIIFNLHHLHKTQRKSENTPSVTISIGDVSVTVKDGDLKDAEHAATRLARRLLKDHPDATPSKKVGVNGKLYIELPSSRSHRERHKKPYK